MYKRRFNLVSKQIDVRNYLTIEALADRLTVKFTNECQYCIDGNDNWITLSANGTTSSINEGQTISFKATNLTPTSSAGIGRFTINKSFNLTGNCMSMLFGDSAESNKSLSGKNYAFVKLFQNCKTLKSISKDFLPATTLGTHCYQYMFDGCTGLTNAPTLPATTLQNYCYQHMFSGCTGLTNAPTLPATTLSQSCYSYMFSGCNTLASIPALPATTLANYCYQYIFQNCNKITTAPELPATTLKSQCYRGMFSGCTGLTKSPVLPATTLADYCYYEMFSGCTGLTKSPVLPATTLKNFCYYKMFSGCTGLKTAPELPATTLLQNCYSYMFQNCSNLNYIKMLATTTPSATYTNNWVSGVSSTGTFVKNPSATWNVVGVNGVPTGWTIKTTSFVKSNYLTIEALADGLRVSLSDNDCYYCIDDIDNWILLSANSKTPSIDAGQTISFKGNISPLDEGGIGTFTINKSFNLTGNCMSMLFDDLANTYKSLKGKNYAFYALFDGCTNLKTVSENFLSATTLSQSCYAFMFSNCTSLTSAPALPATILSDECYMCMFNGCESLISAPNLPATTLKPRCYNSMFANCTSLTSAPALPATTLASNCYQYMFSGCGDLISAPTLPATILSDECYQYMFYECVSLTSAPALPATTLASNCYDSMFRECTGLTTAPTILPATTLASECYSYMFRGCESLTIAPELPATTLAYSCYNNMFYGCTSLTESPELPAATLSEWCYSYMFQNCFSLTAAPVLPAETLVEGCYDNMFCNCELLDYIKMLAIDISANYCLSGWVSGVANSGTFVKNKDATWNVIGINGVPTNWDIETIINIKNYLTIEILEDNTFISGNTGGSYHMSVYYIENAHLESDHVWEETNNRGFTLGPYDKGDKITFKQYYYDYNGNGGVRFNVIGNTSTINKPFNVIGNCMSMCLDSENTNDLKNDPMLIKNLENTTNAFMGLFENCKGLQSVSENFLPATTLAQGCYSNMFSGCTNLKKAPNLPATILAQSCYSNMFSGCTSFTSTPNLPATTLASYCYYNMFSGCTSLVNVSELPATTLAQGCYANMFSGCSVLKTAPVLPAATLQTECYEGMFQNCSNLNYIKMLATNDVSIGYYALSEWVTGVSTTGTFVKHKNASFLLDDDIPDGWNVIDSYNTPSIFKSDSKINVVFYYSGGIYEPPVLIDNIMTYTPSELLSMKPSCAIEVDIYYPNTNSYHEQVKSDYKWDITYTLDNILDEIYGVNSNKQKLVTMIAIVIKKIFIPDENDYEYATGGGSDSQAPIY